MPFLSFPEYCNHIKSLIEKEKSDYPALTSRLQTLLASLQQSQRIMRRCDDWDMSHLDRYTQMQTRQQPGITAPPFSLLEDISVAERMDIGCRKIAELLRLQRLVERQASQLHDDMKKTVLPPITDAINQIITLLTSETPPAKETECLVYLQLQEALHQLLYAFYNGSHRLQTRLALHYYELIGELIKKQQPALATELEKLLERDTPLPPEESRQMTQRVMQALSQCYAENLLDVFCNMHDKLKATLDGPPVLTEMVGVGALAMGLLASYLTLKITLMCSAIQLLPIDPRGPFENIVNTLLDFVAVAGSTAMIGLPVINTTINTLRTDVVPALPYTSQEQLNIAAFATETKPEPPEQTRLYDVLLALGTISTTSSFMDSLDVNHGRHPSMNLGFYALLGSICVGIKVGKWTYEAGQRMINEHVIGLYKDDIDSLKTHALPLLAAMREVLLPLKEELHFSKYRYAETTVTQWCRHMLFGKKVAVAESKPAETSDHRVAATSCLNPQ